MGLVEATAKKTCKYTGKTVTVYKITRLGFEIIDNNISGELILANDCDALYQSLRQLLVDPELSHRYTQNAQHAAAKFSLNEVAKNGRIFSKKLN